MDLVITIIKAFEHLIVAAKVLLHLSFDVDSHCRFILIDIDALHCFSVDLVGDRNPISASLRRRLNYFVLLFWPLGQELILGTLVAFLS